MSCRTSEGYFRLSELKIDLPMIFVWYSLAEFSVPITAFSIKESSNFTCPVGQVGWEVKLSDRYFQLSRAVGQSLTSIPVTSAASPFSTEHLWPCAAAESGKTTHSWQWKHYGHLHKIIDSLFLDRNGLGPCCTIPLVHFAVQIMMLEMPSLLIEFCSQYYHFDKVDICQVGIIHLVDYNLKKLILTLPFPRDGGFVISQHFSFFLFFLLNILLLEKYTVQNIMKENNGKEIQLNRLLQVLSWLGNTTWFHMFQRKK